MNEIKKEDCYICYDKLDYETQALLKPRCGHMYHGKCLLQLTRKPNKNKCAYCRGRVVLLETYKKNRLGVMEWTREPHKEIKIKLKLVGMKRNINCLVCKDKLKGCDESVECRSCYHSVHKDCIQETLGNGTESFQCPRCEKMDFNAPFCFICYKSHTLNKVQCYMCSVWCHRDCYPTTMLGQDITNSEQYEWRCNWCLLKKTPILKGRGFTRAMKNLQLHNNTTFWARKRCDPLLPEKFIKNAIQYLNDAAEEKINKFEIGEKLLSLFAESYNLNTRKLRNREVLVPQKNIVRSKGSQPTCRLLYVTENQVNKLVLENIVW